MNELSIPADLTRTEVSPRPAGGWPAVVSVAAGTFLLVTAEFLPIGLLSRLAHDLHVSEGTAGLAITAPGLVAAFAGPVLTLVAGQIDRRRVVLWLTAAIIASNLIAVVAPSFPVFLLGRLLLGLAVGGLWSFAGAVARRLIHADGGGRATSLISAGIGVGTVWGMPAGAVIGGWFGWRAAFAVNAQRTVTRKTEAGLSVRVDVPRKVRKGWFTDAQGKLFFQLRYGSKPLEFVKGMNAVEVESMAEMPVIIGSIIEAVNAGELDPQLTTAIAQRKANFKPKVKKTSPT